jgi:copper(I)-binding protein
MFRHAVVAGALAALVAGSQGAAAGPPLDLHAAGSPSVRAARVGVGGAATAASAAGTYPNGHYQGRATATIWAVGTTVGCMSLSPIVAGILVNANEHRELTSREVHVMLADCTIPFVGGWLMEKYWDSIEPQAAVPGTQVRR